MLFLSMTAGDTSRPGTAEYADFDEQIDAAAAAAEAKEAELQDLRRQVEDKKAFILEFLATADDATLRAGTPPPAIVMHGRCGGKYRVSDRYGYQYSGAWGMGLGAP